MTKPKTSSELHPKRRALKVATWWCYIHGGPEVKHSAECGARGMDIRACDWRPAWIVGRRND